MVKEKKEIKEKTIKKSKSKKVNKTEPKKKNNVKKVTKASFKSELKKIKWPEKKDMIKYSIATILFTVFLALFFYVIELIMALIKTMV